MAADICGPIGSPGPACSVCERCKAEVLLAEAAARESALREDISRYVARDTERLAEVEKLREALVRIAFGGASGEINDLAGNPMLWSSTTAYLALGGRIEGGTRLDSRELLSGLDGALRTGEEGKSGVDVAEEAKGGSQANVEGSRGMGCQAGHSEGRIRKGINSLTRELTNGRQDK